jgi:LPXTG-site transpeptidase (sortase) family protein
MKRKLIAVLGIASPLFLIGCTVAVLLIGGICWLLLRPEEKSQIIRIIPVGSLATSIAQTAPPEAAEAPVQAPTSAVPEVSSPLPTPDSVVEQVLGFALPAGSVNSVTQEGVASRVVIPKLNVDAPILLAPIQDQTWQVDHLDQAVGHLEGTAPPGSDSNLVLAGHVTLAEGVYGPFAGLGQLAAGDMVKVFEGNQEFDYLVDTLQTVERTAVDVTYPSTTGEITLITCNNWSNEEGRYIQRLIVKGHLVKP